MARPRHSCSPKNTNKRLAEVRKQLRKEKPSGSESRSQRFHHLRLSPRSDAYFLFVIVFILETCGVTTSSFLCRGFLTLGSSILWAYLYGRWAPKRMETNQDGKEFKDLRFSFFGCFSFSFFFPKDISFTI